MLCPCPSQVTGSLSWGLLRQEAWAQEQGKDLSPLSSSLHPIISSQLGQKSRPCVAGLPAQSLRKLTSKYLPGCILF